MDLCVEKMKRLIEELSEWLNNNKLVANVSKTKLMLITPRPYENLPDIYFNGVKLNWVSQIKYLGIVIDNKLTFSLQVGEIYQRISRMHGIFYSLSLLVPQKMLLTIYYSLAYPIIT